LGGVLAAIDFEYQFRTVAAEIGDETADRDLASEAGIGKTLSQNVPEAKLGVSHLTPQPPCPLC
jgi:hypothetical protein